MQHIDQCIERYLTAMETADRQPADVAEERVTRLKEKVQTLKEKMGDKDDFVFKPASGEHSCPAGSRFA